MGDNTNRLEVNTLATITVDQMPGGVLQYNIAPHNSDRETVTFQFHPEAGIFNIKDENASYPLNEFLPKDGQAEQSAHTGSSTTMFKNYTDPDNNINITIEFSTNTALKGVYSVEVTNTNSNGAQTNVNITPENDFATQTNTPAGGTAETENIIKPKF